jgi:hypothetical protein
LPRGAKDAPHRAAGLRAQAGGGAAGIAHEHGLDFLAVFEAEEKLLREAVATRDVRGDGGVIERRRGGEPALERRGKVGCLREIGGEFAVERIPEWRGVGGAQAILLEASLEFGEGEVVQRQRGNL